MKKILSILLLGILILCSCSKEDNKEDLAGDSLAKVYGFSVTIKLDNDISIYSSTYKNEVIELEVNKTYEISIDLLFSGGSTPAKITADGINFSYDNPNLSIQKITEYQDDTTYYLTNIMVEETSITFTVGEYQMTINFSFK